MLLAGRSHSSRGTAHVCTGVDNVDILYGGHELEIKDVVANVWWKEVEEHLAAAHYNPLTMKQLVGHIIRILFPRLGFDIGLGILLIDVPLLVNVVEGYLGFTPAIERCVKKG